METHDARATHDLQDFRGRGGVSSWDLVDKEVFLLVTVRVDSVVFANGSKRCRA